MSRLAVVSGILALVLAVPAGAQLKKRPEESKEQQKERNAPKAEQEPQAEQEPPEEDPTLLPKTYVFNPIEAEKNVKVAAFYWKKGSYKAAALRYQEATKWDPGMAEAWLRLGEAREKLKDNEKARAAYEKFLELTPEGKDAEAVRKKLSSLTASAGK